MTPAEVEEKVFEILRDRFEIKKPALTDNLREKYNFDSIDAIELLAAIEDLFGGVLSQEQKKLALEEIRTIGQIVDYVKKIDSQRQRR